MLIYVAGNSNVSGGWSGEGVEFIEEKSTNVSAVCHSYHLTSFAVLVSVKHESEVVSSYLASVICYNFFLNFSLLKLKH